MVSLTLHVDAETRAALHSIALATNSSIAKVARRAISIGISSRQAGSALSWEYASRASR
jgi:predicted transcriptional regulator